MLPLCRSLQDLFGVQIWYKLTQYWARNDFWHSWEWDHERVKNDASFYYCACVLRMSEWSKKLQLVKGRCLLIQKYFVRFDYAGKGDITKRHQKKKWKLGLTTYFSKIIKIRLGKKCYTLLCYQRFLELLLLNYLWKIRGSLPPASFLLSFQLPLLRSGFPV